jgi:hypothetical protein
MPTPEVVPLSRAADGPAASQGPADAERRTGERWLYAFLFTQFACSLALLVPAFAPQRVIFRSAALGMSLLYLIVVPRSRTPVRNPATVWAVVLLVMLTVSAFNPNGGAPLAVVFHWLLYIAVLAPLFWVARLELEPKTLGRLLLILWAYHSASSIVGLLQVYFPGQFQPALTTFISERQALTIRLANGEWVPRPSGLSDMPGGAGPSGFYATLFGLGVVLTRPFTGARLLGLLSMVMGLMCIYLSQVRVALVMLGVCFIALAGFLVLSGRISGVVGALVLGLVVVLASFELALAVGGQTVVDRLASLGQGAPISVYERNRGMILQEDFFVRLPKYPLGAGLGHWGMMNAYFGSREDEIGAELQWGGWILDGGLPLLLTYFGALVAAITYAVRITLRGGDGDERGWAAIVAAYDVGMLAMCFSYSPFMSALGLDFWVLNATLVHLAPRFLTVARNPARVPDRRGFIGDVAAAEFRRS